MTMPNGPSSRTGQEHEPDGTPPVRWTTPRKHWCG